MAVLLVPASFIPPNEEGTHSTLDPLVQGGSIWPYYPISGTARPLFGALPPTAILQTGRDILLPPIGTDAAILGGFFAIPPGSVRDPEFDSSVADSCLVLAYVGRVNALGTGIAWAGPLLYPEHAVRAESCEIFKIEEWARRVDDMYAPFMAVFCARQSTVPIPVFADTTVSIVTYFIENDILLAPGSQAEISSLFFVGVRPSKDGSPPM
jgi:hypothetical protein